MTIDIDQSFYAAGTASVENGGTTVTGQGTQWAGAVRRNDLFGTHAGFAVRITEVVSDTELTLAFEWEGPTQVEEPYEVQFTPYDLGYHQAIEELLTLLGGGNLEAFADLEGVDGRIPIFTGVGTMSYTTREDLIDGRGDVSGPNGSNDSTIALFDGATGKLIKDSGVALDDLHVEIPIYATVAGMSAMPVPDGMSTIRINDHTSLGDGGGGHFIDQDNGTPVAFTSAAGVDAAARNWYRTGDVSAERLVPGFTHGPEKMKIVFMADAQPVSSLDIDYWRDVVRQVRDHHSDADYLFFLGDLVHRGEPATGDGPYYDFEDFIEDMREIGIPRHRIYYIPGNHDRSYVAATESPDGRSFRPYLKSGFGPLYYSVDIGNVVFTLMGAMTPQTAGDIPDYVVDWWSDINSRNKDKVLITCTHQPLYQPPYGNGAMTEPQRFYDLMNSGDCPVDLWFAGHIGGNFTGTNVPPLTDGGGTWEQYNALHIQCGLHLGTGDDPEESQSGAPSFIVMEMTQGSDEVVLRRWNCNTEGYQESNPDKTVVHQVRHPIDLSWEPSYVGQNPQSVPDDVQSKQRLFVNAERSEISPGVWGVAPTIQWVMETGIEDRYADDMLEGQGVGHLFYVPGASTNTESQVHAYGVGGGISVERRSGAETSDWRTTTSLWSSEVGQDEDSLVRSLDLYREGWELHSYTSGNARASLVGTVSGVTWNNDTGTEPTTQGRFRASEVTSGTAAFVSRTSSTGPRNHVVFEDPSGVVGTISTDAGATAYNTTSDENFKEFLGELSAEDAIAIITSDPVRRFRWDERHGGEVAVGWGAQTSYSVSHDLATPGGWIHPDKEGFVEEGTEGAEYRPWGVDQSKRTPYLWAAVTHLLAKVEELEATITSLKEGKS